MLRWIVVLAAICSSSGALGLGWVVPVHGSTQGLLFALTALSATMLISSFDALETQAVGIDQDDEH